MRKSKCKHWVFAILAILCFCCYACYDGSHWEGQSGNPNKTRKRNKELTTIAAQQWFESHYEPVVTMRSGEEPDNSTAMVKPKWKQAIEKKRGRYEVVQMPMIIRGRRMLMDQDTKHNLDQIRGQKWLRNSAHIVIMKDLRSGHIRSFISIFVGSLEYLKKTKRMSRNTYLYREKDFDGKVLFFKLNGGLINGWKYRNGKIVGKIMPADEYTKISLTRGWVEECNLQLDYQAVEECYEQGFVEEDEEYGWGFGVEVICDTYYEPIYTMVCDYIWEEENDNEEENIEGPVYPVDECDGAKCSVCGKLIADNATTRSTTTCETCSSTECPICGKRHCTDIHDSDSIPNPCERAQELSLNTGLTSRINDIYRKTYPHRAGNTEQGFVYTATGKVINPAITEMGRVSYTNDQIAGHEFIEWYHSHPGGGGSIPSLGDLKALSIRYQQGYIKSNDFTYGVVSYYGCLSIRISSPEDFNAFATKLRNNEYDTYWNANINNGMIVTSHEVKIVQLLQFFQERNAGLSIFFRPMQDEDLDNNNENWKAKEIDTSNQLIDTNCNN